MRRHGPSAILYGMPSPADQQALLGALRTSFTPLLTADKIPLEFTLRPGTRLRTRYGQCRRFGGDRPPEITIRCTKPDGSWRRDASIVGTFLHEAAHLRYPNHRSRFWALCRRLLDQAAAAGLYDPVAEDPEERAQGDGKLAGSAADLIAQNARTAGLSVRRAGRRAITGWQVGDTGVLRNGGLGRAELRVLRKLRTRLEVVCPKGRRYLVPAVLLAPAQPMGSSVNSKKPFSISSVATLPRTSANPRITRDTATIATDANTMAI